MRSKIVRAIAGVVLVALAVVLLVVLKDGGEGDTKAKSAGPQESNNSKEGGIAKQKPAITTITVRGGQPVGGVTDLTYNQGEQVRFKVDSDVADEIHLHGYDISKEVDAGGSVTFDFNAELEGIFEVELEQRAVPIAEMTVEP